MVKGRYKRNCMSAEQVRRFIRKIAGPDWDIEVTFFTDKSLYAYGAEIRNHRNSNEARLRVNRDLERGDPRELLLHEIGHCLGKDPHNPSAVKRELYAQLWAIKRARQLKMCAIAKQLKWELAEHWLTYDWNSGYRRYILASRLFNERAGKPEKFLK
jgi:hypothetical protein